MYQQSWCNKLLKLFVLGAVVEEELEHGKHILEMLMLPWEEIVIDWELLESLVDKAELPGAESVLEGEQHQGGTAGEVSTC